MSLLKVLKAKLSLEITPCEIRCEMRSQTHAETLNLFSKKRLLTRTLRLGCVFYLQKAKNKIKSTHKNVLCILMPTPRDSKQ